jgi:anti-anti-sigma regulatory factor
MKDIEKQKDIKVVILDFELIPYLDSAAIEVLESIVFSLKKNGIKVYFTSLRSKILKQFKDI